MSLATLINNYATTAGFYDEMWNAQEIREPYSKVLAALQHLDLNALHHKDRMAGELFMNQGITFTVSIRYYSPNYYWRRMAAHRSRYQATPYRVEHVPERYLHRKKNT